MFGVLIQKNKLFILCWQSPKNINKAYQVLKFMTFKTHLPSRFPRIILLQSSGLRLNEVPRPWSFHFLVFSLVRPFLISSCPPGSRLLLNNARQCSSALHKLTHSSHSFPSGWLYWNTREASVSPQISKLLTTVQFSFL